MYAALGTRPDIMFATTFLSQFMQNPGHPHWEEVKCVFHYIKGTIGWKLVIGTGGHWRWTEQGKQDWTCLEGFSDTNSASQHHQHSTSDYVFTINSRAISWSSKKQPIIALSTTKAEYIAATQAEYIAATHAAQEALWIWMFLSEVTCLLTHPLPYIVITNLPYMFLRMTNSTLEWGISIFNSTSSTMCPSRNYSPFITAPLPTCLPTCSPKPYLHHSWHTCVTHSVCILLKGRC